MLKMRGNRGDLNVAIEQVFGVDTQELSDDWQPSIRDMYEPVLARDAAAERGRPRRVRATVMGGDSTSGRRSARTAS